MRANPPWGVSSCGDPITGSGLESLGIPDDPETQLIMAAVFRELLDHYADNPEGCTVLFSE